jgi:lantibiotic modifying enzyme
MFKGHMKEGKQTKKSTLKGHTEEGHKTEEHMLKRHTYIENLHKIEDHLLKRLIREDKVEEHMYTEEASEGGHNVEQPTYVEEL